MIDYRTEGQITVSELIAALQKQPRDSLVLVEGGDCTGAASGVTYVEVDGSVMIERCD
jgi:hypothetical protein